MFGASQPSSGFEASQPSSGSEPPDGRVDVWCVATMPPHSMPPLGGVHCCPTLCLRGGGVQLYVVSLTSVPMLSEDSESRSSVGVGSCIMSLLVLVSRPSEARELVVWVRLGCLHFFGGGGGDSSPFVCLTYIRTEPRFRRILGGGGADVAIDVIAGAARGYFSKHSVSFYRMSFHYLSSLYLQCQACYYF